MKRRTTVFAALAVAALVAAPAAKAHDFGINTNGTVHDCADVKFRASAGEPFTGEDRLQVAGSQLALRVGESNGVPVKITGSDRSGYELLLCKGADNAAVLAGVKLSQRGTEVTVTGPDSEEWGGYLLVKAPKNGQLDVETSNGPIAVDTLSGQLALRAKNGPVGLRNMSGSVTVDAKNGPISFAGSSGQVKLTAINGPMTIQLEGTSWDGGELQATTKNGPLSLRVPDGFATGIEIDKKAHTPFRCPAELCGDRTQTLADHDETVAIGNGPRRIHLSTENGPVSVGGPKR